MLVCKGSHGHGRDEVVLHEAAAKNIVVLGIQETRRPGRTVSTAAGYRVFYSGSVKGGQQGVALAVKESICKTSKLTREGVNERLISMRFEMTVIRFTSKTVSYAKVLTSIYICYSLENGTRESVPLLLRCSSMSRINLGLR